MGKNNLTNHWRPNSATRLVESARPGRWAAQVCPGVAGLEVAAILIIQKDHIMPDANMHWALLFAQGLVGTPPTLPASLEPIAKRAEVVKHVNGPLVWDLFCLEPQFSQQILGVTLISRTAERIRDLAATTAECIDDVQDPLQRINIVLRLWAGCLMGAKTIADQTNDGPVTPQDRQSNVEQIIAPRCKSDAVFAKGVEAAPAFKRLLEQDYFLTGVPAESLLRNDAQIGISPFAHE